jgi:molybdate transport system ATP-binding protein
MLLLNFKKRISDFVLSVEAQIPDGLVALFGPSGAGKTTTLNAIAGLIKPDSGEIRLSGAVMFSSSGKINIPAHGREIGCVFQESRLFPHLSALQNLRFGFDATPHECRRFLIEEIIEVLQISKLLERKPSTCSAGEQQRIALGRALLASPKYLLMDEPLAAVDVPERWRILAALREIHRRHRLPVLYVSHDPGTVLNFAEHMILMRNGRIESSGAALPLFQRFVGERQHPVVENTFAAVIGKHGAGFSEIQVQKLFMQTPLLQGSSGAPLPIGEKLFVQIPASEILLATQQPVGLSARNIFPGIILNLQSMENVVLVEVDVGEKIVAEVLPTTVESLDLKIGARVFVIIKASGIRRV